jgi:hypothetical protein
MDERKVKETYVRHKVLTVVTMKIINFWGVTPCSLAGVYRRLGEMYHINDLNFRPV